MPEAGNIKIVIYDILGRVVKLLVNEYKQMGRYEVDFDATALSSGVYCYTLQSENYTATYKMMVMK